MGRVPCCDKVGLKKGPWTPEEDHRLVTYIQNHGHSSWRALPKQAGLSRCGKSCRLRWTNYLRPDIKRGNFSSQEENSIIQLHAALGNRWSTIATHLPGRTDNEIKNHWNTRLRKRLVKMGIDPATHRPWPQQPPFPFQAPSINTLLLSLLQPDHNFPLLSSPLLAANSLNINALFPAAPAHMTTPSAAAPPPPPPAIDPALLAAAETRLVLDCLKFNTAENHSRVSDHQTNQLLTRLLLVKLLQGSNNHATCYDSKALIHNIITQQAPLTADQSLYNQGLHRAASMLPAATNRLHHETSAPATSSAYILPNLCVAANNNGHGSNMPPSVLSSIASSSYQQRLLQALPFLAESAIEPCTSAATEHLSSNRISQNNLINCPPDQLLTPNGSLTSQQAPLWSGGENQQLPSGAQLLAAAGLAQNNHQIQQYAANSGAPPPPTWMTWEELLMSQQKGGDKDPASSSTVNTTSSSTLSSASAAPNTPTNNINIQDYWSNLLNLISPTSNHPLSTASD